MDGLSVNHCCDPNSLEDKADLSASFPELWASTLLQFFWVADQVSLSGIIDVILQGTGWLHCHLSVQFYLLLTERHICSWHKYAL